MQSKCRIFMKNLFLAVIILFCSQNFFAQTNCSGTTLFTEKKCAGDEVNSQEKELFRIVNEYRAKNNLPPIMLSEPLSIVANRHLLDLTINVKYLSHGWSNCPYDVKNEKTWNCVFESPQRLGTSYKGQGFENLYRNLNGNAAPVSALEAWKKSPLHNNLILNLDIWKNVKFDAFGLAISGNYAAIWFGTNGEEDLNYGKKIKGLGISFQKVVEGLTGILSIEKESSNSDSEKWVGNSADKTIKLEIYGTEKDIAETAMAFSSKLSKNVQMTPQNRAALSQFLKNVAEKWDERDKWMDATLLKLAKTPQASQFVNVGKITIEVNINAGNTLQVVVKPYLKPVAKEI